MECIRAIFGGCVRPGYASLRSEKAPRAAAPGGGTMNRFWGHTLSAASLSLAAGQCRSPRARTTTRASSFTGSSLRRRRAEAPARTTTSPTALMLIECRHRGRRADETTTRRSSSWATRLIPQGNSSTPDVGDVAHRDAGARSSRSSTPQTNADDSRTTRFLRPRWSSPASGSQPSYAGVARASWMRTAIAHFTPASARRTRRRSPLVYVTFYGETLGGQSVQEQPVYQFPVNVCFGCLVHVPNRRS